MITCGSIYTLCLVHIVLTKSERVFWESLYSTKLNAEQGLGEQFAQNISVLSLEQLNLFVGTGEMAW